MIKSLWMRIESAELRAEADKVWLVATLYKSGIKNKTNWSKFDLNLVLE